MKIGILQTAYKKASDYGAFYNVQELGLGRALAGAGHNVILYKGVDGSSSTTTECDGNFTINLVGIKYIGINGLLDTSVLDPSLDILIYFCDTQIIVPAVYSWCRNNNVTFYPYIGVIESHSENFIKRFLMKYIAHRNIKCYRKCSVLAKTPDIHSVLQRLGCKDVRLFPVGLDETVMKQDFSSLGDLSRIHACVDSLLFIGRMEDEKHPLEMLEIYEALLEHNSNLKLTMIGDGYLYEKVYSHIESLRSKFNLPNSQLRLIRKVKYSDIADYYLSSSCYINLNRVEILGMSILEAMYYECPVFAIKAPGPDFIIGYDNNPASSNGFIAKDKEELINLISPFISSSSTNNSLNLIRRNSHACVSNKYLWTAIARNNSDIFS